jgi:hypothetical protein
MRVTGILLLGLLTFAATASANSIVNGSFETGNFDGWTIDHASSGSLVFVSGHALSGSDAAWFGALGGRDDSISQTLDTEQGDTYVVSFWLGHGATDASNDFTVWWGNTPLLTLTNAAKFGYREYSFIATAADDLTTLRFSGRERLNYYYLDDVSVEYLGGVSTSDLAPIPTPEPATIALMLGGLAALAGRARFARKNAPTI